MARTFDVPAFYRSPIVSAVKTARRFSDPRKRDLTPSTLDFGPVRFKLARHFGFCYGVENAIEISYRALTDHPDRRIYLLSEMIHNPDVNEDLQRRGVKFLRTTSGEQLIPFDDLEPDDVVVVPAFGAAVETLAALSERGIDVKAYDTTCPFVERVWKRSAQIGRGGHTVVVHGKRLHEETRATFSHAAQEAPVVVVRDLDEARALAAVIEGRAHDFAERFHDRCSDGFDPEKDLVKIGVVNQTTMLATETVAIADLLRSAMVNRYGPDSIAEHFADTSDTLCYATTENQDATSALIADGADVALIVGGYNSSNTTHLVELCEEAGLSTYFINRADDLLSPTRIRHFDLHSRSVVESADWLPTGRPLDVLLTAGASCPDILLDEVIRRITDWEPDVRPLDTVMSPFENEVA